jgi:hypothetical protein
MKKNKKPIIKATSNMAKPEDSPGLESILTDSSRATADLAVGIITQKPALFGQAYQMCMEQKGLPALRAARVVQLLAEQQPALFEPYLPDMVSQLPGMTHSSVKRCMMKVLTFFDLSAHKDLHGQIIDAAFMRMNDPAGEIATRAYATEVLRRFIKPYPEIAGEFIAALQLMGMQPPETLSRHSQKVLRDIYRDSAP